MTDNSPVLPDDVMQDLQEKQKVEELRKELQETSRIIERAPNATKVFVGIPNMNTLNVGLVTKLFAWARDPEYFPWYHFVTEKRHTDYARNILADEFLKTNCAFMVMVDADVDPNIGLLSLVKHNKDIIAANVHCWMNNELIPSLWQMAECEQCFCLKKFTEEHIVHDPSQYFEKDGYLYRWLGEVQRFEKFAHRNGILGGMKCRCEGTGLDPWVFRTWQIPPPPGVIQEIHSAGSAAMVIRRNVVEAIAKPHFMFLYRPSREILLTEDHYFCWKASKHGFKIWGDFEMLCSHYKLVDLLGILQRMYKSFNAGIEFQKTQQRPYQIIVPTPDEVAQMAPSLPI